MKPFTTLVNYCFNLISKKNITILGLAGMLVILLTLPSCSNYYQIRSPQLVNTIDTVEVLQKRNKLFIIHVNDTACMLANAYISDNMLKGDLFPLNEIQQKYQRPKKRDKNPYLNEHEYEALNEVHLYTTGISIKDTGKIALDVSAISRIDVNEKNIKATKRSHLLGGLIVTVGAIGGIIIIASVTMASMFDGFKPW